MLKDTFLFQIPYTKNTSARTSINCPFNHGLFSPLLLILEYPFMSPCGQGYCFKINYVILLILPLEFPFTLF
jgi:hypothetical protein